MEKRLFAGIAAVLLALFSLTACSSKEEQKTTSVAETSAAVTEKESETPAAKPEEKGAVLLSAEDSAQADAAWSGVKEFAEAAGYLNTYAEWRGEKTEDKLEEAVASEAAAGFWAVVCYGDGFGPALLKTAPDFPDTRFVLLAAEPLSGELPENVLVITWAEEQAGFLAGYAAVWDGNANLGFIGRADAPQSTRYGYGFVQGADAAALEMEKEIAVRYARTEADGQAERAGELAAEWFQSGTEVIFADGNESGAAVSAAAEEEGKEFIGADAEWDGSSPASLAFAVREIGGGVRDALNKLDQGKLQGGTLHYDAALDGVTLSMDSARFDNFSAEDYKILYGSLKKGDYAPLSDVNGEGKKLELSDLKLTNTEIKTAN